MFRHLPERGALRPAALAGETLCGGVLVEPGGSLVGKRYVDESETLEFLCTRGGEGNVSVNGVALEVKQAKRLPSSD